MLETSARLLRLLSLLQSRRDWSGAELAQRLGVTDRTVRRDVGRLRALGYPVRAAPGTAGGYRLGAGAALPPLLLDDDEAVAAAVGLQMAAAGTIAGLGETALRALTKLQQVLPARLRARVDALQSFTVPLAASSSTVDPSVLAAIAAACRDREHLRFDYHKRDGGVRRRRVEPYRLVCTDRRWYLLAWDLDRDDWRVFRTDRIGPALAAGGRFTPREPPQDVAAYVSRSVSSAPYLFQAKVLLHAPASEVAPRVPPTVGLVEMVDDGSCRLYSGANSLDSLAVHIALLGFDFEVLDPPELRARVRVLADRLAAGDRGG